MTERKVVNRHRLGQEWPHRTSVLRAHRRRRCDCMRGFRIVRPSGRVRGEAIHSSCVAICVQPPARAACPASGRMFSGRHVRSKSGATVCVLGVRLIRWGSIADLLAWRVTVPPSICDGSEWMCSATMHVTGGCGVVWEGGQLHYSPICPLTRKGADAPEPDEPGFLSRSSCLRNRGR